MVKFVNQNAYPMKALLLGFDHQTEKYENYLRRLGCTVVQAAMLEGEAGLVFMQNVRTLNEVTPYVQRLCHIFVGQHSLSSTDLQTLHKLAGEAGVQVHFSAPPLYRWSVPDLVQLLRDVKFVQVYKDFEDCKMLSVSDLRHEILAAVRLARARISRVERVRSIVPCDFEVLGLRVDFTNAASSYFWLGGGALMPRHELRLFGSKGLAVVDVLKRETSIKTLDGNFFTTPFLSEEESEEKELADFVGNLRRGTPAFISAVEVEGLRLVEERINN